MEADGIVDPLRRRTLIKANLREDIASQLIGGFWKKGTLKYRGRRFTVSTVRTKDIMHLTKTH